VGIPRGRQPLRISWNSTLTSGDHASRGQKSAEKARDIAGIIGSLKHEGYVLNPEDEAIHQQAARGEITTKGAIPVFRERGLQRERKAQMRKRPQPA
jgi:hypothetical protein